MRRALSLIWLTILSFASQSSAIAGDASLPLLDRNPTRSPLAAGCNGQSDAVPLPPDPRSLVVPGVNTPNAAVQFNAYFVDVHNPPPPFRTGAPRPMTCGEWRASVARGEQFLYGKKYNQTFSSAFGYNNLWRVWGLLWRPADFDEQIMNRYGLHPAPFRNPYPKLLEDPARSDGGSGQLPLGFVQGRNADGKYNGQITVSCSACHDSHLGNPGESAYANQSSFTSGRANDAFDYGLIMSDLFRANTLLLIGQLAPYQWSTGRGINGADVTFDVLSYMFNMDTLDVSPGIEVFPHASAGMVKVPHWWQRPFKTRQFWDGSLSADDTRRQLMFAIINFDFDGAQRRALATEFEDVDNYFLSLSPPTYTGPVNIPLAEIGAVLFHEKNLWANGADTGIPKPPGNGSCAGCHGVYSPRYAANPDYLPDPRLKGVAGVIVSIETINTDRARFGLMANPAMQRAWSASWWGYNDLNPEWKGFEAYSSPFNTIARYASEYGLVPPHPEGPNIWSAPTGYMAPSLYGAWAGAPYFHNGSVPDIWSVLKPDARPPIWRRHYTPAGQGGKNRGYDRSLASYDFDKLGWRYDTLPCKDSLMSVPFLPCSNNLTTPDMFYQLWNNVAGALSWLLVVKPPPPITDAQIEARMIYNSHLYSQGNGGHKVTAVLTDEERWALIEYLKTL